MTISGQDPQDEQDVGPLGSSVSQPAGDDRADGMAGPVYPPPETEPDAAQDSTRRGLGRLLPGQDGD